MQFFFASNAFISHKKEGRKERALIIQIKNSDKQALRHIKDLANRVLHPQLHKFS